MASLLASQPQLLQLLRRFEGEDPRRGLLAAELLCAQDAQTVRKVRGAGGLRGRSMRCA